MSIISNGDKIIKIMDNAGNVIADLQRSIAVSKELPLVFRSGARSLAACTISGNIGGVGDLDSSTSKYVIPITIKSKNILVNHLTTQTYNGLTLTVNADKSITVSGTASATTTFYICDGSHRVSNSILQEIENGSYYISGAPEGVEENKYVMSYLFKKTLVTTSQTLRVPAGEDIALDNSNGTYHYFAVSFTVWEGIQMNNVIFKPMLRTVGCSSDYEPRYADKIVNLEMDAPIGNNETVNVENISVNVGTNILSIGTTIQPKEVIVKGDIEYVSSGELSTE